MAKLQVNGQEGGNSGKASAARLECPVCDKSLEGVRTFESCRARVKVGGFGATSCPWLEFGFGLGLGLGLAVARSRIMRIRERVVLR